MKILGISNPKCKGARIAAEAISSLYIATDECIDAVAIGLESERVASRIQEGTPDVLVVVGWCRWYRQLLERLKHARDFPVICLDHSGPYHGITLSDDSRDENVRHCLQRGLADWDAYLDPRTVSYHQDVLHRLVLFLPLVVEPRLRAPRTDCFNVGLLYDAGCHHDTDAQAMVVRDYLTRNPPGELVRCQTPGHSREEFLKTLRMCSVLVQASGSETHPNVLQDAWSMGIPVLLSSASAGLTRSLLYTKEDQEQLCAPTLPDNADASELYRRLGIVRETWEERSRGVHASYRSVFRRSRTYMRSVLDMVVDARRTRTHDPSLLDMRCASVEQALCDRAPLGQLRICLCLRHLWPPMGGEYCAKELAEGLALLGHRVDVYYTDGDTPSDEPDAEVSYRLLPTSDYDCYARMVGDEGYDLVVVHDFGLFIPFAVCPCRKICSVHYWTGILQDPTDAWEIAEGTLPPLVPGIRESLLSYDLCVANSDFTRDLLLAIGLPEDHIIVCWPNTDQRILPRDGSCRPDGNELRPLVVGKAKMRDDVLGAIPEARVIAYDAEGTHLSRDEMRHEYERASCLVHPTFLTESFSRVALEAMAFGLPVLYPNVGNLPNLIGTSAGIGLPRLATPEEWRAAIRTATRDRLQMGHAGRRRAKAILSHNDQMRTFSAGVKRATKRLRAPKCSLLVPPYPGVRTACKHLGAEVPNVTMMRDGEIPQTDVILLAAYYSPWFRHLDAMRKKAKGLFVWWHSDLSQSGDDGSELERLNEVCDHIRRGRLDGICCTAQSLVRVLADRGVRAFWLPDTFHFGLVGCSDKEAVTGSAKVSLFSAPVSRKNHAASIGAASLANAELHVFPSLLAQATLAALLRLLRVRCVVHDVPLDDKTTLYRLLAGMTCSLVPSHSETFCYGAAEAIAVGTPCIGSSSVPVLDGLEGEERSFSILADPNDTEALSERILALTRDPGLREHIAKQQFANLENIAVRNRLVARRAILDLSES